MMRGLLRLGRLHPGAVLDSLWIRRSNIKVLKMFMIGVKALRAERPLPGHGAGFRA
jgi:hypothetical protein